MLQAIRRHFTERFTLEGDEERAFNRLESLLDNPPRGGNLRNQVSKIANLLDLETPTMF